MRWKATYPGVLFAVVAMTCCAAVVAARAASAADVRAEVPIRAVVLPDGNVRYAVPVTIGSVHPDAGLDTGSSGLRVLPGVLGPNDAQATAQSDTMAYGSGVKIDGVIGNAAVAIGALSRTIPIELVRSIGCTATRPACPATRVAPEHYGIMGDGIPDAGFKAILGANMAQVGAATSFRALGAHRWIIDLPAGSADGRLVLNPTDAETAGYVSLPIQRQYERAGLGLHDSVDGCAVNVATQQRVCGPVVLDSGAGGGIAVLTQTGLGRLWQPGTPVDLQLRDNGRVRASVKLTVGAASRAARLTFGRAEAGPPVRITTGTALYSAFSVLYDSDAGTLGFKPRERTDEGLDGTITP